MSNGNGIDTSITITVTYKVSGYGEPRPDLVARALREKMPRTLFRVDIEPQIRELITDKPDGWDDYYISLDYRTTIT